MADFADTIAALSTPSGESAIALVRLSGPACADLAKACFNLPSAPAARRAARGLYTLKNSSPLDDCVFTFFKAPSSYTGEDMLEISCHGNPFIVQNMLCDLFERGARAAGRGEFTRRAFLNAKLDLSQAEAVALMISSSL
ncbi:MAG: tRNA uridine-5-carboxymethylaminomethyl(34) synthesis GTPase MnmE, partial [Opitutales bacterium]|nr:tRNA uridine-5-carboxymethylaminomethyl(34) synthesis GTPase MnmE [Opitutales bacterium]